MICVLKEYEIKTNKNGTGTMTTAKNVFIFFISLNWLLVGGNKNLVGRVERAHFLLKGGLPHTPVGKTLHKLCQQVFI